MPRLLVLAAPALFAASAVTAQEVTPPEDLRAYFETALEDGGPIYLYGSRPTCRPSAFRIAELTEEGGRILAVPVEPGEDGGEAEDDETDTPDAPENAEADDTDTQAPEPPEAALAWAPDGFGAGIFPAGLTHFVLDRFSEDGRTVAFTYGGICDRDGEWWLNCAPGNFGPGANEIAYLSREPDCPFIDGAGED
ncbi:hypothetical protein HKCCE2091_01910 [Rhodobacterales bacterium HKCCE2091]|nr:hypothetical protein [Rhodobacterales bacterium HKCCE2091]